MSNVRESRVPRKFRSMKSALVVLAAAALVASACGSGDKSLSRSADASETTTAAVAGAQENAVTSAAVCYGWPNGTTDAQPCAVGLKGPGGGRVFYDAGSEQPWGRFLEVAPQAWGGTLYPCPGNNGKDCGAADGVQRQSSDSLETYSSGQATDYYIVKGYLPCRSTESALLLPGEAADTAWAIGGGRHNTEVLSKTAQCVDGSVSALTAAAGYRGGGLSDWYLPSGGELTELCRYTGRNAIGGFTGEAYLSSTVGPKGEFTNFFGVNFGDAPTCTRVESVDTKARTYAKFFVRPIRAFS